MSNYLQTHMSDEQQKIQGKLELEDIVRRQIDACNRSAPDEFTFNKNVEMLMYMLPSNRLKAVQDRKDEYTDKVEKWVFEYWGSIPLGTIEKPYYINTPDSPYWDGGEPILKSPIKTNIEVINYNKMYTLILRMFEEAGLTWKQQLVEIEGGSIEFEETPDLDTPTPTYEEEEK